MSRYIVVGSYNNKGSAGLIEGGSDRAAAVEALCNSVGATLVSADITRGKYDFCIIAEAGSFEMVAAMTLKAKASGAIDEIVTLEVVDYQKVRSIGKTAQYTPPND